MNRGQVPKHYQTLPEPRTQILKRHEDERAELGTRAYGSRSSEATVKRISLAEEVKGGNVAFPTLLKNPDSLSNMEKGTTSLVAVYFPLLMAVRAMNR